MTTLLEMSRGHADPEVGALVAGALDRVVQRFNRQLDSDLPPVAELCRHIERYRGKMLRPTLVILSGLSAGGPRAAISDELVTVAAVVEMIHLATLVHDDVLDEAGVRRGASTVNALSGNETAVMLGDYLIARSFHLCSTLDTQATALRIGEVTSTVCEGEMLQLFHRGDLSLGESRYFDIVERKTASLIAVACELGARHAGADATAAGRLWEFGRCIGVAFQVQDDLLDLIGDEATVGKSLGKDLEMEKLTLPVIHHLATLPMGARMEAERLIHHRAFHNGSRAELRPRLEATGSITHARAAAARLVEQAKASIDPLMDSPAKQMLLSMADAVITRRF